MSTYLPSRPNPPTSFTTISNLYGYKYSCYNNSYRYHQQSHLFYSHPIKTGQHVVDSTNEWLQKTEIDLAEFNKASQQTLKAPC
jgi:hypothetical protein